MTALAVLLCGLGFVARATASITMYDYNHVRYTHHESVSSLLRAAFTGDGVSLGNVVVGVIMLMTITSVLHSDILHRKEWEPSLHCSHYARHPCVVRSRLPHLPTVLMPKLPYPLFAPPLSSLASHMRGVQVATPECAKALENPSFRGSQVYHHCPE